MTEGQGELRFDSETQTRNEQNQARASLERVYERLAEWQADDHADADDVMVELPDGTRKLRSELTGAEAAAGFWSARGLVGWRGNCAYSALQLRLARERPKWRRFKGTALMPSRSCRIRPLRRWS
jgi:hypothetical protein